MARLCIRIAPNDHPTDPSLTPLRTQPGDVVCIVGDGHVFSLAERTNGQYRIFDLPGVPQEDLLHLVEPVKSGDVFPEFPDVAEQIIRRRKRGLDMAALRTGAWRTRKTATTAQVAAITVTRDQLAAITVTKA